MGQFMNERTFKKPSPASEDDDDCEDWAEEADGAAVCESPPVVSSGEVAVGVD